MKTKKTALLLGALLISVVLIAQLAAYVAAPASAMGIDEANGVTALPMIFDFETGLPGGGFADPGGAIATNVVTTDTLTQFGVITNHVLAVSVVTPRAWAGLQGFNLPSAQNWTAYDGLSFWFKGTNSGKTFLLALDQGAGNGGLYQAPFTDNSTGWKYISLPWQAFSYREGATGTPNLGLTGVTAYFIQFSTNGGDTSFSGTFYMDQLQVFDTATSDVFGFEAGLPGGGFADPGGAIATNVVTTDTLTQFGVITNHVLAVSVVTPRAWAGLQGFNLPSAQNWTAYDGLSFWFKGTNSGKTFLLALDQGAGNGGLYQAPFTDNTANWKLVSLPWQAFSYREGATGTPNLGLTGVTAYFIQFATNGGDTSFSGTFYMDQLQVFDTATSDVFGFEAGLPGGGFADPGGAIATNVVTTDTLTQFGVITNHVLAVSVVTPRAWAGLQGFNLPSAQNWTAYDGLSFWFKGTNSGKTFLLALDQGAGNGGLYQAPFTDNTANWKLVSLPWQAFSYREGATGTPNLGLTGVTAYFIQFSTNGGDTSFSGTFYMDQLAVFGPTGTFYVDQIANPISTPTAPVWQPSKVSFTAANYSVNESIGSATIGVALDAASTVPVTVSYTTLGGTALAGADYTAVSGTLVFAPGVTALTFGVPVIDNATYDLFKTVGLSLTNVISGELGTINPAALTILDNDAPDSKLIENFDGGLNGGTDLFNNPIGFVTWGSTIGNVSIAVVPPNSMLKVTSNIENWGGFTDAFRDGNNWTKQDWSRYDGVRFWFYGTNSGKPIQFEVFDNRELGNVGDSAERWYQRFTDDFTGWRQIALPFALFQRRTDYQPGGAPADGLNLTDVSGFAFNLPSVASTTTYYVDLVEVYGDLSQHPATTRLGFSAYAYGAIEGQPITATISLNTAAAVPVTVTYVISSDTALANQDFTGPLAGSVVFAPGQTAKTIVVQTLDDHRVESREQAQITITSATGAPIGYVSRSLLVIIDNDVADPKILDDFENGVPVPLNVYGSVTVTTDSILSTSPLAIPGQDPYNTVLSVTYNIAAGATGGVTRKFDAPKDLSQADGLGFWYYGTGSGQVLTVTVLDNGQPDPGPTNWTLAWSDEFSGANGAAPNPANWTNETGGWGWGNNEWEYYTNSRDNSALDGNGNLVITAMTNTNPALTCSSSPTGPNGMCFATSARVISAGKQEFTHGRVEARIQIPKGQGIWPAFWMLGNDIFTTNPWPASGEIDIMENIGKPSEQSTIYGTIHGPGYSGGSGIGSGPYVMTSTVSDNFHVFAIEWEPTRIRWFVDGTNYFTATDTMRPAGTNWVFNHPFFILLNVAVGGGWPGYPDNTTVFPQQMKIDYMRVYQAPDTAERFEATFVDNVAGWQRVYLPFDTFTRSAVQPVNAPNDGLTLTAVQGYRFDIVSEAPVCKSCAAAPAKTGAFYLDDVRQTAIFKVYLPIIRH